MVTRAATAVGEAEQPQRRVLPRLLADQQVLRTRGPGGTWAWVVLGHGGCSEQQKSKEARTGRKCAKELTSVPRDSRGAQSTNLFRMRRNGWSGIALRLHVLIGAIPTRTPTYFLFASHIDLQVPVSGMVRYLLKRIKYCVVIPVLMTLPVSKPTAAGGMLASPA